MSPVASAMENDPSGWTEPSYASAWPGTPPRLTVDPATVRVNDVRSQPWAVTW